MRDLFECVDFFVSLAVVLFVVVKNANEANILHLHVCHEVNHDAHLPFFGNMNFELRKGYFNRKAFRYCSASTKWKI